MDLLGLVGKFSYSRMPVSASQLPPPPSSEHPGGWGLADPGPLGFCWAGPAPELSVFPQDGGPPASSPSSLPYSAHMSDPWPRQLWAAGVALLGRQVRVLRTDHPAPVVLCLALLCTQALGVSVSAPRRAGKLTQDKEIRTQAPPPPQLNKKPNGFWPSLPVGCVPLLPTYLGRGRGQLPPV